MRCRHFNYETDNSQCIKDADRFYVNRMTPMNMPIEPMCSRHIMSKWEYDEYPSYEEAQEFVRLCRVKAML